MTTNNYKTTPQQQLVFTEAAPLSRSSSLPTTPELEIEYGELTDEQQEMVTQSLDQHLAMALAERKAGHAAEGMVRLSIHIGELYVEADFQLEMIEARANGRQHEGRIRRFLERRRDRLEQSLEKLEEQSDTRLLIEASKSVYPPQRKVNENKVSFLNFRIFTSEKTEIIQAPDQEEVLPVSTGTLFGNRID